MGESKLTKGQFKKIQAKIDKSEKSGLAKKQTREEMLAAIR